MVRPHVAHRNGEAGAVDGRPGTTFRLAGYITERIRLAGCRRCVVGDRSGLARCCRRYGSLVARVIWMRAPLVTSRSSALLLRDLQLPAHIRGAPHPRPPGIQRSFARLMARTKRPVSASGAVRLSRTRGGQMGRKRPGLRQEQYDRGV